MKRILISVIAAFSLIAPLSAFEWGGLLDNNSKLNLQNKTPAFSQSNAVYLWGSSNLSESGNMYIKGEGMYKYTFNTPGKVFSQVADLDLLKFSGNFSKGKANINVSAGRFIITDLTGSIFAQNSDGAFIEYAAPKFGISAYAGYTGLLNSNAVTMLDKDGNVFAPANKVYALANPYIPLCFTFSMPSLFMNQTLAFQTNAFIDLSTEKYNRMYATVNLTGPLASKVFYNFVTDFGTENFKNISNFTKLSVSAFPVSGLYITGAFEYASGNNGALSAFRGFSSKAAYSASKDFQTTGEMIPSVSVNYAPNKKILVGADLKTVFSCPENKVSATGLSADLNCIYNIFSDLNLTVSLSGFKGYTDASLDNFSANLKLAVAF